MIKICIICKINKNKNEFSNSEFDKKCGKCRGCVKVLNKKYKESHKTKISIQRKKYRSENKQELNNKALEYYYENKEEQSIRAKEYRKNNREYLNNYNKQYYINNLEREKERSRIYVQNNKEKTNKRQNVYILNRRKNDPAYKLRQNISHTINKELKKAKGSKNNRSISDYISYTMDQLRNHLENLFESWMTWENYGMYNQKTWNDNDQSTWKWNIDHIIPQSELIYNNMAHANFQKCWTLSNLRPYSAKQNILDGNRRK